MVSFNLIEEPWIPCASLDGQYEQLTLRHVFQRASEYKEIAHSSPLVVTGIHRLLLAVLHRCFDGPGSLDEWHSKWITGGDTVRLNAYLDRWTHRFDLFDPDYPFFQTPYMEDAKEHSAAVLMEEKASGNNSTLFDHNVDDAPILVSPAEAACYLIARQAYSIGFGNSKPFYFKDSALVRGLSVRFAGDNLFETLMLNLVRYNEYTQRWSRLSEQRCPV